MAIDDSPRAPATPQTPPGGSRPIPSAEIAAPASVDPFRDDVQPELAEVRGGEDLDWGGIEAHLRANLPDDLDVGGPFEVLQFPNGAANLTYQDPLRTSWSWFFGDLPSARSPPAPTT